MIRVALLVEPFFVERHVGVRNLVFALKALLDPVARVDFVSFYRGETGRRLWFRTALRNPRFLTDGGVAADRVFRGSPAAVYADWRAARGGGGPPTQADKVVYTQIGGDIGREGYRLALITAPWVLDGDDRLPFPEQFGLAHDIVPNRYALDGPDRPFVFAAEHSRGYRYYRTHCRATVCNSPLTRQELLDFFAFNPRSTVALPPVPPAGYFDLAVPDAGRRRAVVLASPLDKRKGLGVLPALLNPLAGELDRVGMYGGVRCRPDELDRFFAGLHPGLPLEWYPEATVRTVQRLFGTSRLLLFPSYQEGLGIPLLEAQLCGCRVAARPVEPMASLMLGGAVPLPAADARAAVGAVRRAVADDAFPHGALRSAAVDRFHPGRAAAVLRRALGLDRISEESELEPPAATVPFPMARTG